MNHYASYVINFPQLSYVCVYIFETDAITPIDACLVCAAGVMPGPMSSVHSVQHQCYYSASVHSATSHHRHTPMNQRSVNVAWVNQEFIRAYSFLNERLRIVGGGWVCQKYNALPRIELNERWLDCLFPKPKPNLFRKLKRTSLFRAIVQDYIYYYWQLTYALNDVLASQTLKTIFFLACIKLRSWMMEYTIHTQTVHWIVKMEHINNQCSII